MAKKFIQGMNLKKGAPRKTLKAKKGKDIPLSKLRKATSGKGVSKLKSVQC